MGAKYASAITPGQDLTTFGLTGQGSYSELIYALNSNLVTGVITTTDTTAKVHTFTPAIRTEDAVKTYTIEQGGSVRAVRPATASCPTSSCRSTARRV